MRERQELSIRDYYERTHPPERTRIRFAIQREARGTADAVLSAEAFAGGEPFLVLNSDNYYPVEVLRALVRALHPGTLAAGEDEGLHVRRLRTASRPRRRSEGWRRLSSGCGIPVP